MNEAYENKIKIKTPSYFFKLIATRGLLFTCPDFIHRSVRPGHLPHPVQDPADLQTSGQCHFG